MKYIIIILLCSSSAVAQVQVRTLTALQTKVVDINKATIGLDKVENIAPADMPMSDAVRLSLRAKSDSIRFLFSLIAQIKSELLILIKNDTTYYKGFTGNGSKDSPFEDIENVIINPTNNVGEIKPP